MVYNRAHIEDKILRILYERAEAAQRSIGDAPVNSNAFNPDTEDSIESHQEKFKTLRRFAFYEMRRIFPQCDEEERKLITDTLNEEGCKVVTDASRDSEDEDLD